MITAIPMTDMKLSQGMLRLVNSEYDTRYARMTDITNIAISINIIDFPATAV